jgi:class 3 adenylate cyclase
VASLARIKRYHDTIRQQADELAEWNAKLESRVARQVEELERTNRLRRFLSPQLADLVVSDENLLQSHRREIVVVFTDLRNFTPFAERSEPEEVMGVLAEYHRAIGSLVRTYEATLERFTGDGIMVFFNDPIPCDDAAERAVRMALELRDAVKVLSAQWFRRGHDLPVGIGIAQGFATLGRIGFEGRFDYAAIGSVTNLAARLCSDAGPWQVLVTDRVLAATEHVSVSEMVGDMQPKGFSRSVRVHNITALKKDR